jgi:hypothetical protein
MKNICFDELYVWKGEYPSSKDQISIQIYSNAKDTGSTFKRLEVFQRRQELETQKQGLMQHMKYQFKEKDSKSKQVKHLEGLGINLI